MFVAAVGTNCSPQVVEAQKKLEKTKKAQVLSNFLKGSVIFRKKEGASTLTPRGSVLAGVLTPASALNCCREGEGKRLR